MKKEFLRIAKTLGFELHEIRYKRPEFSVIGYEVDVYKNGSFIKTWDAGYFIGEVNSHNSKDQLLPNFENYLKSLL